MHEDFQSNNPGPREEERDQATVYVQGLYENSHSLPTVPVSELHALFTHVEMPAVPDLDGNASLVPYHLLPTFSNYKVCCPRCGSPRSLWDGDYYDCGGCMLTYLDFQANPPHRR